MRRRSVRPLIKVGVLLAVASCSSVDCAAVSCRAGGVTVDASDFLERTPAAESGSVSLCVGATCSRPVSLTRAKDGQVFVELALPRKAKLSVTIAAGSRTLMARTAKEVKVAKGQCCPGLAVLRIEGDGSLHVDGDPY